MLFGFILAVIIDGLRTDQPVRLDDVILSYGEFQVTHFPQFYGNNITEAIEQVNYEIYM